MSDRAKGVLIAVAAIVLFFIVTLPAMVECGDVGGLFVGNRSDLTACIDLNH